MTRALCLILLALSASSCAVQPPRYRLTSARPHKDLLVFTVYVERSTDSDEYADIATQELSSFLSEHLTRGSKDFPLYEARFDFLVPSSERYRRTAMVQFRLGGVSNLDTDLSPRVSLYPTHL